MKADFNINTWVGYIALDNLIRKCANKNVGEKYRKPPQPPSKPTPHPPKKIVLSLSPTTCINVLYWDIIMMMMVVLLTGCGG